MALSRDELSHENTNVLHKGSGRITFQISTAAEVTVRHAPAGPKTTFSYAMSAMDKVGG